MLIAEHPQRQSSVRGALELEHETHEAGAARDVGSKEQLVVSVVKTVLATRMQLERRQGDEGEQIFR